MIKHSCSNKKGKPLITKSNKISKLLPTNKKLIHPISMKERAYKPPTITSPLKIDHTIDRIILPVTSSPLNVNTK